MTPQGCHLKHVVRSRSLTRKARAFVDAEALDESPGALHWQQQIYKNSGLLDESPETFLEMKTVMLNYRKYVIEKARQKAISGRK